MSSFTGLISRPRLFLEEDDDKERLVALTLELLSSQRGPEFLAIQREMEIVGFADTLLIPSKREDEGKIKKFID